MKLSNYVAEFISQGKIFSRIFKEQQKQLDEKDLDIQDLIKQCFIETATWSLSVWEEEFGVHATKYDTLEDRRNRVLAQKRGCETTTKTVIKEICLLFAEKANVIEHNEDYWFETNLETHSGFTNFIDNLIEIIEELKPAHLGVKYTLTSIKEYKITHYFASTLVNTKKYTLTNDINASYLNEGNNNVASNLIKASKYELS